MLDKDNNIRITKISQSYHPNEITQFNDTNLAKTKLFLIYVLFNEKTASTFSFIYFIGIDKNTFKMNFVYYESKRNALKQRISFEFDFEEFFSCHTPFSRKRQLKGIYFSNQTFFIFIKRFYLKIGDDLVSNQFSLEDDYYRRNAENLSFKLLFEYNQMKWIKTLRSSSVLCGQNLCFQLNTDSNNKLLIEDFNFSRLTSSCLEQTLVFDNHVYCFLKNTYFQLGKEGDDVDKNVKNRYSIKSIFQSSIVIWEDDQKLKFTLNYIDNKFILMTIKHIFVFDYDKFKSENDRIVALYQNKNKYLKIENCLFSKCRPNSKPPTKLTTTTKPKTTESTIKSTTESTTKLTTTESTITESTTKN